MRTFIAVDIPVNDKIKSVYEFFAEEIKGAKLKFTEAHQNHITLSFLGEISEEQVKSLHSLLLEIHGFSPISLELNKVGIFKHNSQSGVIWIGILPNDDFIKLWERVNQCVLKTNISVEIRKFSPHLTLGRVKNIQPNHNIYEISNQFKDSEFGTVQIDHFILYQSILTPNGPIYKPLHKYKFT